MNKLIAYCGIDCEKCDARIATVNDDNDLRVKTSREWCQLNHTDQITPETINCMGCRTEGEKFYFCSHMCQIRQCASAKGFDTCGNCSQIDSCPKVGSLWENNPELRKNLL